jgi:hypothetical protein
LAETTETSRRESWAKRGAAFFAASRGDLQKRLTATLRAARYRHQVARARHDMRTWQVERRKRTRHLIELGGLVVKAGAFQFGPKATSNLTVRWERVERAHARL